MENVINFNDIWAFLLQHVLASAVSDGHERDLSGLLPINGTFRREVGFALSLVRPIHHQMAKASEAGGDLICEEYKRGNMSQR